MTETRPKAHQSRFMVIKLGEGDPSAPFLRVPVNKRAYVIRSGWGLWDICARGWVAGYEVIGGVRVMVPWSFARKASAQKAVSEGLYLGYGLYWPASPKGSAHAQA